MVLERESSHLAAVLATRVAAIGLWRRFAPVTRNTFDPSRTGARLLNQGFLYGRGCLSRSQSQILTSHVEVERRSVAVVVWWATQALG